MTAIKQILAHEILNSRGEPTIEARVILEDGTTGIASCPNGGVKSNYEAFEMRDGDATRFQGKGVLRVVELITTTIAPRLIGVEGTNQQKIDANLLELDGTQSKTKLGANTMLAVSMAAAKAGAKSTSLPLFLYLRQYTSLSSSGLRIPAPAISTTASDSMTVPT